MPDEPADQSADRESPSLTAGTVLGHYEVLSCIGSGGMGEVYRARDRHLARDVAIKVLRRHILERPRARIDFQNEAKALSRLAHPNIATIHDFDTQDGIDFLVMEFVNGESLADRVHKGALPHEEWTSIGRQICDALGAAHAKGIVHRDLKPRNVFLDEWGHVKVLDFGLAKLAPEYLDSTATTERESQTGRIVGTPPYMAPEQLRGERIDHRTDVYALGVTLYEMATGKRAFTAPTRAELIVHVLEREPERPKKLRPDISSELERTIVRAMSRDRQKRHQSARDLAAELHVAGDSILGIGPWVRLLAFAAVLSLLVVAGWLVINDRPSQWPVPTLSPLVREPAPEKDCSLSPDGEWISYSVLEIDGESLWRTARAGGASERLLSALGEIADHAWSPNGRQIAVIGERLDRRYMQIIPAFGGVPESPTILPDAMGWPTHVDWEGNSVYVAAFSSGIWRFDVVSKSIYRVLEGESEGSVMGAFDVCDQERHVLVEESTGREKSIWLVDLANGRRKLVRSNAYHPLWLGGECRQFVYASQEAGRSEVWRGDLDREDSRSITLAAGAKQPLSASAAGTLVACRSDQLKQNLYVLQILPNPDIEPLTRGLRGHGWPTSGQSGRHLVFQRMPESSSGRISLFSSQIVVADVENGKLENVRPLVSEGGLPILSGDDRWIAYRSERNGSIVLHAMEIATLRNVIISTRVPIAEFHFQPLEPMEQQLAWSPTGSQLYYSARTDEGPMALMRWDSVDSSTLYVAAHDSVHLGDVVVADGGRSVAFTEYDPQTGAWRILEIEDGREQVSTLHRFAPGSAESRLQLRGCRADGGYIALEVQRVIGAVACEDVTPSEVDGNRPSRELPSIRNVYAGTIRYDRERDRLLYTGIDQALNQEIRSLDLASGVESVLTTDRDGSSEFGAVAILQDGDLVCLRQEAISEFFLIDLGAEVFDPSR